MSTLTQALIAALIVWLVFLDYESIHLWTYRPIILGPIMGLALGNLKIGLEVGATLELMFLATVWVGSAIPPNETLTTGIATALAVITGSVPVAIATAIPIALLGTTLVTLKFATFHVFALHRFEASVERMSKKGMIFWGIIFPIFITHTIIFAIPTFVTVYYGADAATKLLTLIPENFLVALTAGGQTLGAVGIALLLTSLDFKKSWPFFFLGFIFAGYMGLSTIGLTILSVVIIAIISRYRKKGDQNKGVMQ